MAKYLFLSDLHLGDINSEGLLVSEFNHQDYDQIFLLGDTLDLWKSRLGRTLDLLKQLCNEVPDNVVYIVGNHDDDLVPLTEILPERFFSHRVVYIGDFSLLITHGHTFDKLCSSFTWRSRLLAYLEGVADRRFGLDIRKFLYSLSHMTGTNLYPKLVDQVESKAVEYCWQNHYNGIIMGHTHVPVIKYLNGVLYCNCGDWVQHRTYIELDDSTIILKDQKTGAVISKEDLS